MSANRGAGPPFKTRRHFGRDALHLWSGDDEVTSLFAIDDRGDTFLLTGPVTMLTGYTVDHPDPGREAATYRFTDVEVGGLAQSVAKGDTTLVEVQSYVEVWNVPEA